MAEEWFREDSPGLFVVHYNVSDDMAPVRQAPLVEALKASRAKGPVAILIVAGDKVRTVDPKVPKFWLDLTSGRTLQISAIGVVNTTLPVRMAVSSFSALNRLRGVEVPIATFERIGEAKAYCMRYLREQPISVKHPDSGNRAPSSSSKLR